MPKIKDELTAVVLDRRARGGEYARYIDVLAYLAQERYGNGLNALIQIIKDSPLYQSALLEMQQAQSDGVAQGNGDRVAAGAA